MQKESSNTPVKIKLVKDNKLKNGVTVPKNMKINFNNNSSKLNINGNKNGYFRSQLVSSIISNQIANVVSRIQTGDSIEEEDERRFKPIHYACKIGNIEMIKYLINEGCDVLATNIDRISTLHVAVREGLDNVVSLLLDEGVKPDVREKITGRTPVHDAVLLSSCKVLQVIINKLKDDPWEARRILKISDKNGQTALHMAAHGCIAEAVTLLLAAGADVATTDNSGLTPMHLSLMSHGEVKDCGGILTHLLEAGGDVEVQGVNKERLFHLAAKVGCSLCLDFLYFKGANIIAKDRLGRTPLHLAAMEGKVDAVRFLISRGVDIKAVDDGGLSSLHMAILKDNPKIINFLIQEGTEPGFLDPTGKTYVQVAIINQKLEAFQALVRNDFTQLDCGSHEDVIHYCSALGLIEFIKVLLDNDWDINLRDSKRRTALHRCLNHGHEALAILLISYGASLHAVDESGATPLHYAVRWGGSDTILRLMVKRKANMNVRDRLGRTPLHYAASKSSIMSDLYILLGAGAQLEARDQMGLTPLHLAARLGNESLVRILLENGAKNDIRDVYNFLPIDHAKENDNKSIVKRLLEHDIKTKNVISSQIG